jgi:hypothetical protein
LKFLESVEAWVEGNLRERRAVPFVPDEQVFRYNNRRDMNDWDRFDLAVSQIVGKRLTYAELTGKVGETAAF